MHELPSHFHPIARYAARRSQLERESQAALITGRVRTMPRDGRGRFLSNAWRRQAETFTAADLAWFRGPIGER